MPPNGWVPQKGICKLHRKMSFEQTERPSSTYFRLINIIFLGKEREEKTSRIQNEAKYGFLFFPVCIPKKGQIERNAAHKQQNHTRKKKI